MALEDIETIVFLMLENRSFDHVFGYLGASGALPVEGLRDDAAWLDAHANMFDGISYPPAKLGPDMQQIEDPPHTYETIGLQIGVASTPGGVPPMNGFVASYMQGANPPAKPAAVMGHYDAASVPVYDFLARNYCICDHWFAALPCGTQPNRMMAMSGSSPILDNAEFFLPAQDPVYDWLTAQKISWCTYQWGNFFPFFSLMPDWLPEMVTSLALSALGGAGRFRRYSRLREAWMGTDPMPSVIFIEPEYTDGPHENPNDDHPPTGIAKGQALVADLYATLTANPQRWQSTLLIITYDEHGGFFDHVPPLPIPADAGGTAIGSTGVRVPALLISPHVAPGVPFTGALDHTSFLQLLADRFTPGKPYSPDIAPRHAALARIADALTGGSGEPAALPDSLLAELQARVSASPVSAGTAGSTGAAKTTAAFHNTALSVAQDHPDMLAGPGWESLAAYVAAL